VPSKVQPLPTADAPTVDAALRVTANELAALRAWADERVQIEYERAQELQALGRPHDYVAWRAAFALQVSSVLETLPVPA
jgi:hypothetical protein